MSKKWADYSDDSEQQNVKQTLTMKKQSEETEEFICEQTVEQQLSRLAKHNEDFDIWLDFWCQNDQLLKFHIDDLKSSKKALYAFRSEQNNKIWNVKVKLQTARQLINQGLDDKKLIKIRISDREKRQRKTYNDNKYRDKNRDRNYKGYGQGEDNRRNYYDRERRGGRRGRGRGREDREDRNNIRGDQKEETGVKKVYVNKETGKRACNKEKMQQQLMEDKQRHYSKQQAEKKGLELGSFRNKPPKQEVQKDEFKSAWIPKQEKIENPNPDLWQNKQQIKEKSTEDKQVKKTKKVQYKEKQSDKTANNQLLSEDSNQ